MASFSESFERSWSESESLLSSSLSLLDLPAEVLVLILRYLPLSDLANTRLVCTRLQKLVDAKSSTNLWASAPLLGECGWVSNDNRRIIERAAGCGNVEALVKLAVAYLYDEGVPACDGKGSYESLNGIKATEYLIQVEDLCSRVSLFSWVLFRPPWSLEVVSSKMCVFHHMRLACQKAEAKQQPLPGIHYSIGKALSFYSPLDNNDHDGGLGESSPPSAVQGAGKPLDWYERGAASGCPFSALEVWKIKCKPHLREDELECIRQLRGVLSTGDLFEAQLELCRAYAVGHYGGISEGQALAYIRHTMDQAKPVYTERIFTLQDLNPDSRYILMDWLFEVSCLKEYPPHVAHLIVNMVDSYLLRRQICKAKLQLLAIAAALLASRWCVKESLTIREASWLTDRTYDYDDVVRMVGELVAAHKGNIKKSTIIDYLDILLCLIKADMVTRHMSYYLSESILLYPKFGRFSPSFLAAACLLEARVLLGHDYPWSSDLMQATGLTVGGLKSCCLMMYQLCLTDKYRVTDSREVQLKAIVTRFGSESFSEVSQMTLMSYKELKEQLGWDHDISLALFTPPASAKKTSKAPKHKKRLSFLSDSQYLTSPPSTLTSDSELDEPDVNSDSDSESHSCSSLRLSDSNSSSLSASLSESQSYVDPDFAFLVSPPGCGLHSRSPSSSPRCSSQSLVINPNGSGFPQPDFCDIEEDRKLYDQFVAAYNSLSSLRETSSSGSSSVYEPTTMEEPRRLTVENTISCSTSGTSVASDSSGNTIPAFVDEDSKFSDDDKMSTFVDEDSRSLMDTLTPGPSNSQTDELSSFMSSLPLPTPCFSGALERDTENTPFENDPTSTSHTLAAVKQNLHLGSCETQYPDKHHIVKPRAPLQSLENLVQESSANACRSKDVILSAKVRGRGRSFVSNDTESILTNKNS